jgi:peroxiredoxin Q/BCP
MRRSEVLRLIGFGFCLGGITTQLAPGSALALGGPGPALDQPAPEFVLEAAGKTGALGQTLGLADFKGSWLLVYFFPRDFTSGCTLEAQGFQHDLAAFQAAGAAIVGISADSAADHARFCSSEGLSFPLLSDPGGAVSKLYGSWLAPFSLRHSFLIDPQGILRARWLGVNPAGHSQDVLQTLRQLQSSPASTL